MEWYEWVFDGVGTALVGLLSGFISYKAAVRKIGVQEQKARDEAFQKQNLDIDCHENNTTGTSSIRQIQKAGNKAQQIQIGEFRNGN